MLPYPDEDQFKDLLLLMSDEEISERAEDLEHNLTAWALRMGRGDHDAPYSLRSELEQYRDISLPDRLID